MKSYVQKPKEVIRSWYVLDASDTTLGRVSSKAAELLLGKHKPTFTSHVDGGDYVVIINAALLHTSANKAETKKYYRHSGYPGNLKTASLGELMVKNPKKALELSIKGMLPSNKLEDARLARLKIYVDSEHQHEAQKPVKIDLKKDNK